jgi:uncharacterized protein YjdB
MKNLAKWLAIITLAVVIGSSFAACGDAGDSGGVVMNEKAVYTSVDADGNKYELTITPKSDRAAYEPKAGDTYTLKIFYVDGTTKTSVGTVTQEVRSGSTVTATLSVSDSSFTVTLSTITEDVRVFTEIKGTIPITSGNDDDDPPTIEIELTLTPRVEKESDAVIGVILNKTALSLDVGGSETLVATVLPTNAKNNNVTWSSSDTDKATVSETGEVSAVAEGNAVITVTTKDGDKTAICNVNVRASETPDQIPVAGDFIISGLGTYTVGQSFSITIIPKAGKSPGLITIYYNGSEVAPSAVGTYIVTFDVAAAQGWKAVTGIYAGTLVISEDGGGVIIPVSDDFIITGLIQIYTGSPCTVTVMAKAGKSTGLITVYYNGSATAPSAVGTYIVTFDVGAAQGWNSASGLLGGRLVISATPAAVIRVSLNKAALEIGTGDTEYLTATIEPANATNQNVTWISSNEAVATVSEFGAVTGVFPGSATITVTTEDGNKTATCTVNVFLTPAGLAVYLAKLPANTASSPHNISLRVRTESESYFIREALQGAPNKFVSIDLSNSTITRIPASTFYGCSSLISVSIPDNVTSIEINAFWSCANLASLTFSATSKITSIGDGAFTACASLASIIIPNSVTSISQMAFYDCTSLASVTIGNSVTSIGDFAFQNCTSLASVTFVATSKLNSIGDQTFLGCTSLTSIIIPDSVKTIDRAAFYNCTSLASVTIGNGVTSIGNEAFRSCTSLASVTIGNSVTSINQMAFYYCTSLASVTIGNGVTNIGEMAFQNCASLASVTFVATSKITSIGYQVFVDCISLSSIDIPNSVKNIGQNAFNGCTSLDGVIIPNGVTSIGSGAFGSCTSLSSITIPNSVTSIGYSVFSSCTNLADVIIGNGVPSIEDGTFGLCSSLASVTFVPTSKITSIGYQAFLGCTSLSSIDIPSGVTSIGENALRECASLTSVTIPFRVKSIGACAFWDCASLASVTFEGTIPLSGISIGYAYFHGDLLDKFYATDPANGTPGTYIIENPGDYPIWTLQQ